MERNPKQADSQLFDCRPQTGICPHGCNQCFYNSGYYEDINKPNIPSVEEVGEGIVRMNAGNDSNNQKDLVIQTAKRYKHVFFNTSVPNFDFPGPVVYTANREEESGEFYIPHFRFPPDNLMFVRLRVSSTNLSTITYEVDAWTGQCVPVVLTFMRYYDKPPDEENYSYGQHIVNSYWMPTRRFKETTMRMAKLIGGRLVTMCGTLDSEFCRDCRNCEFFYWQTVRHLREG